MTKRIKDFCSGSTYIERNVTSYKEIDIHLYWKIYYYWLLNFLNVIYILNPMDDYNQIYARL